MGQCKYHVDCYAPLGQERYRAITSAYYRGAVGAMLVYDIAKGTSFQNLDKWIVELRQHTMDTLSVILVGNKSDLRHLRMVERRRGCQYAADNNLIFIETSALDSTNVSEAFENLFRHVYETMSIREREQPKRIIHVVEKEVNGSVDITKPAEASQGKAKQNKGACCGVG